MTRMQPHIVITLMRQDRANTIRAGGTHIPRKSEKKHSSNFKKKQILRSQPPRHPAWKRHTASVLRTHEVDQRHPRLASAKKNPTRAPRTQLPPRSGSP
jgi:hypothetical protein